ncbi:MAG: transcriptional regulator [Pseudomonadota bacterium]
MTQHYSSNDENGNGRLDSVLKRIGLSKEAFAAEEALGRGLEWHEQFLISVDQGLSEAERGEFVALDKVQVALNKYRPTI